MVSKTNSQPTDQSLPIIAEAEPRSAVSSNFDSDEKDGLTHEQRWTTRPAPPRLLGLLPTVVVCMGTLGFVAIILGVVLGIQCTETTGGKGFAAALRNHTFWTFEHPFNHHPPPGNKTKMWVVTISSAADKYISLTSSIVTALIAYRVGAEWLRLSNSPSPEAAAETPSPAQYGLLVRLLGTTSFRSIFDSYMYTANSRDRIRLPRIFRESLYLTTALWVVARLIGIADIWLHSESFSIRSRINVAQTDGETAVNMWGVSFNNSICQDVERSNSSYLSTIDESYWCRNAFELVIDGEDWANDIGFNVMTNATDAPFQVGLLNQNLAFAFPGANVVDLSTFTFTFPTFAAQASCTSLNKACQVDDATVIITNCTPAGYPQLPYSEDTSTGLLPNRIFGFTESNSMVGQYAFSRNFTDWPEDAGTFKMAVQLQWNEVKQSSTALNADLNSDFDETSAVYGSDTGLPTLFAACDLHFYNAFMRWDSKNQQMTLLNTSTPSIDQATALWEPLVFQFATEQLSASLMHTARKKLANDTMASLNQNLAQLALATAAGFYELSDVGVATETVTVVVVGYPVRVLLTFLFLLCLYALLTFGIFLLALRRSDEVLVVPYDGEFPMEELDMEPSTATLAQRWLTDPMPLIGHSFAAGDGRDGQRSAAYRPMNTVFDGDESHMRLTIGLNGDRFGITSWGQRQGNGPKTPNA